MLIPKQGIQGGIKHLEQADLWYWSKAGISLPLNASNYPSPK